MDFDLHDGKKVLGTVEPTDAEGNPAEVEAGSLKVTSSDESLVAVAVIDDTTFSVSSVAGPGTGAAVVTVEADADLGEGTKTITETHNVTIIAGEASGLGTTFGAEEDR